MLELRIEQVCKYPIENDIPPNKCSFCNKLSFDETTEQPINLRRCTRCFRSAYCNTECQKADWSKHNSSICNKQSDRVGFPFILTLRKSKINPTDFEENLRKLIITESSKSIDLVNFDTNKKSIFELELLEQQDSTKKTKLDTKFEKLIDSFENSLQNTKKTNNRVVLNLQLKWNNNDQTNQSIKTNLNKLVDLRERLDCDSNVDLGECLHLFTQPEKLTSENPWYCSKCKKHQEATKQMNIWKLPKYLIVTLKRFQASKASDTFANEETTRLLMNSKFGYLLQNRVVYNKLNTFVKFPLRDLDMSKYLISLNKEVKSNNCIYDLCAVINHLGQSLSVGHYTACARTHDRNETLKDELGWRLFDDQNVYPIRNESQIVSKDAYVLMYRLRSPTEEKQSQEENLECESNESSSVNENDEFFDIESEESVAENDFTNLNEID